MIKDEYIIYEHTYLPTGQTYVGRTSQTIEERSARNGRAYGSTPFGLFIKEKGAESWNDPSVWSHKEVYKGNYIDSSKEENNRILYYKGVGLSLNKFNGGEDNNSPEIRERRNETFKTKEAYENRSKAQKIAQNRPEVKEKQSRVQKEVQNQDWVKDKIMNTRIKNGRISPVKEPKKTPEELREIRSRASKEAWDSHPERREELSRRNRENNPALREEAKAKISSKKKEFYSDPNHLNELRAKTKESWDSSPERRKELSEKMKGSFNPSYGKKWYTNGRDNFLFVEGTEPEGFVRGMTKARRII